MSESASDRNDAAALARERVRTGLSQRDGAARSFGLRVTSGTTGREPVIIFHKYPAGVSEIPRAHVLFCYGSMSSRLANTLLVRNRDEAGSVTLAIDDSYLSPTVTPILDELQTTVVAGYPSYVARVSGCMSAAARARIERLHMSGEAMRGTVQDALAAAFPSARVDTFYVSAETGRLSAKSCGYLPPNQYHPAIGVTFDVDAPNADGIGELVVTVDRAGSLPLRRYRIGDRGRFVPETCACGNTMTVEVVSRSGHDYLKVAGAVVRAEEVDRVIRLCTGVEDYRLVASQTAEAGALKGKLELVVRMRAGDSASTVQRVEETFLRELRMTPTRTLGELVREGIFAPLSVRIVDRFETKGKAVRLSMKEAYE